MKADYAIAAQRAMNDYDANMSEEDKKKLKDTPWWGKEPKTAYCMMSASPMQSKVNSEKW